MYVYVYVYVYVYIYIYIYIYIWRQHPQALSVKDVWLDLSVGIIWRVLIQWVSEWVGVWMSVCVCVCVTHPFVFTQNTQLRPWPVGCWWLKAWFNRPESLKVNVTRLGIRRCHVFANKDRETKVGVFHNNTTRVFHGWSSILTLTCGVLLAQGVL